jgi:hypothetical protein
MSADKRQTAMHEAGHALLIYLLNKAVIYNIVVERELPLPDWDGAVNANWKQQPSAEEIIRVAYAGPCAEMKFLANLDSDEPWDFDLTDPAPSFIHPEATLDGIVRIRFCRADGQTKEIEHEHGPFGTDRTMAQKTGAAEAVLIAEFLALREILNLPANWNGIVALGDHIANKGHRIVHRTDLFGTCPAVLAQHFPPLPPPPDSQ